MTTETERRELTSIRPLNGIRRFLRVRTWLIAFALVPVIGATVLLLGELNQSRDSLDDSVSVTVLVDEVEQLGQLRQLVLAERTWAVAQLDDAARGDAVDLDPETDPEVEADSTGLDLVDLEAQTTASVDASLAEIGWPELERQLFLARRGVGFESMDKPAGYDKIIAAISERVDEGHNQVSIHAQADASRAGRTTSRIGLLVLASILFAIGLASSIGRPLRRLEEGTRRLRDGEGWTPLKPTGPTEVREAMYAINEAAAHLELAERQAQVLAEGRLDDEVLNERAPGTLGLSLQEAVQTLARSLSDREEFRRRLAHEATHDGLTQLANRKASLAQLEQSLARTSRAHALLAVMFIDLDGFKEVNDTYGHQVGDAVLWTLGKRLYSTVRAGDHVGRLGGDEFLVTAEPVASRAEARMLAKRVADAVKEPMAIGSLSVSVTVSIGVAIADGVNGLTATELLHDADLAVYRAKELGRSRIELCDEALHRELVRRSTIEDALRHAIPAGELTMFFQPILNAETRELASLEALVRWDRPGHGITSPDVFIPIAERTDLISDVDNWVVGQVLQQLAEWTHVPGLCEVPISINVSGRHLAADGFVNDILDPVVRAGIDPSRLIVEITESALVDDLQSAAEKLQHLRSYSIKIAIDDFGTGYTSLGHLRSLPIDILKIDRTFISDDSASSLVKLIIDTGHLIGASITSEGIETADQAAHLSALGSDALQGFLFARPMPADAVERQLAIAAAGQPPFLH